MDIFCLLNLAVSLAISVLLVIMFFKHYNDENINKITKRLAIIGLAHFLISVLSLLWFLEVIKYTPFDFAFVYSLVVLVQTVFLIMIFSLLYNRKMLLLLFFYITGFFSFLSSGINLPSAFLFISFLLLIVVFILLSDRDDFSSKVGYTGLVYASLSLILIALEFFGIGEMFIHAFLSNTAFLFLVYMLMSYFKKSPPEKIGEKKKVPGEGSHFFHLLKYFVFIITIVNLVFIGTIGLNEFGHYAAAEFYDCEYRSIVYGGDEGPHTEILCKNVSKNFVTLAGVLLPLIVALLLFLVGGTFMREIALLTVGFGLLGSYQDLLDLGVSNGLVIASSITGMIFLVIGVVSLSKAKTEEHVREVLHF